MTPVATSVKAAFCTSTSEPSSAATTWIMGRPKALAKSQSRLSWAGTAMMAPVP